MDDGVLKGWTVAVVGGDVRMLEHMRLARLAGAKVQHYGSVPGAEEAAVLGPSGFQAGVSSLHRAPDNSCGRITTAG